MKSFHLDQLNILTDMFKVDIISFAKDLRFHNRVMLSQCLLFLSWYPLLTFDSIIYINVHDCHTLWTRTKQVSLTGVVSNFFNALCKRATSSLQKRKHHYLMRKQCCLQNQSIYTHKNCSIKVINFFYIF